MNKKSNLFKSTSQFFGDAYAVSTQEWRAIFSDPGVVIFFILVPIIYPLLYGSIYNTEHVEHVPMVVVNEDNSSVSREYVRRIDASPDVRVVASLSSQQEAQDFFERQEAYGCLVIPSDFARDLARGEQATVTLISDLSSVFYYKAFMMACNDVALQMGREMSGMKHFAGSEELTQIAVRPVQSEFHALYNPQGGYATFLLPSVLILILQQTMLLGVCMLVGTARERKKLEYISPQTSYRRGLPLRVTIGRSLAYLSIYFLSSLWTLVIVPSIFRLPMLANPWELMAFLLPYILSITFFAQSIALFVRGREDTIIYLVFTSVLCIFLIGVSWPESALPPFWKAFSLLLPCAPGAKGYIALTACGASLTEVGLQYKELWVQVLVYLLFSSFGSRLLMKGKVKV